MRLSQIPSILIVGQQYVLQGLGEGYFAQHKEHHQLTEQKAPAQSIDEIDELLREAGLRPTSSEQAL